MKTIIKHTAITAFCLAFACHSLHAQTIKVDTLPGGDIEIKGLDTEKLKNEEMDVEKGKEEMKQHPTLMKEFNLPMSAFSSSSTISPTFPTTYPNFKPCFCPVIMNAPALDPTDPKTNIGFDEVKDKGVSNWVFFMGMNRPWLATVNNQAWFECNRYYTGAMVNAPGTTATGLDAYYWKPNQYADFEERTRVMSATQGNDAVGGFPVVPPDGASGNKALRLNRPEVPNDDNYYEKIWGSYNSAVMAVQKVHITSANPYLTYKYAVALSNYFGHGIGQDAFFRAQIFKVHPDASGGCEEGEVCCEELCCEGVFINAKAGSQVPGLQTNPAHSLTWGTAGWLGVAGDAKFKDWTSHTVNFLPYLDGGEGDFIIAFTASYCKGNHDYGYAYVDLEMSSGITYTGINCEGSTLTFKGPSGGSYGITSGDPETYEWKIYKINSGGSETLIHTSSVSAANKVYPYQFMTDGNFRAQLTINSGFTSVNCAASGCSKVYSQLVTINACDAAFTLTCNDCIESFAPLPGKKYVMSAWVKQSYKPATGLTTYTEPSITLTYTGASGTTHTLTPSGPIIDGWQKIEQEFTIPATATEMHLTLNGSDTVGHEVYYDDVRVFPFDGDMKSFVYDPSSQKLMAEMDENNYATYYEYDDEGKLRRVKKETERGVLTIKEAGNNNSRR